MMDKRIREARLYGILDFGYVESENAERVCGELISGGVDVLQLRAKGRREEEVAELSERVVEMCRTGGVPFVVNDFPEVAARVGADGVHVGQDDGSLVDVRKMVGETMLVGRSTHSFEQAVEAFEEGFDYIGFGPLFPTPTKEGRPGIGVAEVRRVQGEVGARIPVFCIGGVKRGNLKQVLGAGAERVVIVSDILLAESIQDGVREVKRIFQNQTS